MSISCSIYDRLELYSMHQQSLKLTFAFPEDESFQLVAKIADLYVREGKEYLLTDSGQEYPLDFLINVEVM